MRPWRLLSILVIAWAFGVTATWALDRPKWMDEPGIVMAGNWEGPTFRARRMGRTDYKLPPEKLADYARERTPEMVAQLKELGVNFLMIQCYKGAGFQTEREGMEDAKQFAQLAHRAGLRVGAYIGGTLFYERLFPELPAAVQWQALGPNGEPLFYHPKHLFRYAAVRNHPGFIEYLQKPVRFAIKELRAELIHFDNFGTGASTYDPFSKQQFREYLKQRGKTPSEPPALAEDTSTQLVRDWTDYKCEALASHYAAMSKYIRRLNPRCGVECNPLGVRGECEATNGIDHARLLPLGNAFWDESYSAEWSAEKGITGSRLRSLKVGQLFNNSTFVYCESALDLAESMAFNVNCLGSVAWFEWGKIETARLSAKPLPKELKTYIRFFLDHQNLFRHSTPVADVAVLRTFADTSFGSSAERTKRNDIEQNLIQGQVAWRIIYDEHVNALDAYRAVIVPEKTWLTADQQRQLDDFAARRGTVVPAMSVANPRDVTARLRDKLRVVVEAPPSVAIELCEQANPKRVLLHFVNYNAKEPIQNVAVKLQLASGKPSAVRVLSPDPAGERTLAIRKDADRWSFALPQLKVYAVAIIEEASVQ